MRSRSLLTLGAAALAGAAVSACSPSDEVPSEAYNGEASLTPLSQVDLSDQTLDGDLSCSFVVDRVGTVFTAMGFAADDGPAHGMVRAGGALHRVSTRSGGFDALIDGAEFEGPDSGSDVEVEIDRTSDEPLDVGGSPAYPARIEIEWDEDEVTADGLWSCSR